MPLFRAGWQASPAAAVSSAPPSTAAGAAASHAPHVDALAHIDLVVYAGYEIRAQYPSPYPLEELPGATPTPAPAPASTLTGEVKLFVCDRCFKYMALPAAYLAHQKECQITKPPGRRVYQRGATSIWEIDGAQAKLYCQNLCLFAKLFIEHKYMFFDVESFTFYLLTEAMGKQEWVLGYFSKEKISYDDYNLACIVVFPPFRQRGWATLLIEFSYELSRRYSATPGTPERPLSELGQRGYLAYWISLLVRYFR
ncbi:acyl-CoA N-acyltransferase, partial [Rhodotorula sp. JG-1b]